MNKKYAFVLGNNTALSIAEIYEVLKRERIKFLALERSREILLIECSEINDKFMEDLGGTIKIIEMFHESRTDDIPDLIEPISKMIQSEKKSIKYRIGISVYDLNANKKPLSRATKSIYFLNINLKKNLKKEGTNLAFLKTKERALSSASVLKNKLVQDNGAEISLIVSGGQVLLGKTIAVQNIDLYTKLDVGRPKRDMVSGTTPPKLAKIMINLAGKGKDAVLCDPFCGSGTYVQEMILLGYNKVYASDISEKAVEDTAENISWLEREFIKKGARVKIFQADARKLSGEKDEKIDAVVSETYLGPPLTHAPDKQSLSETISEISSLFIDSIKEIKKVTANDTRLVMAIPVFNISGKKIFLPVEEDIEKSGYKIVNLLKGEKNISPNQYSERNTFIYSRPDQLVYREILVLEKK